MIREIIVTSPAGVRLAFEAKGEKGLAVLVSSHASMVDIVDCTQKNGYTPVGLVPTSWLIELNEEVS